MSSKRQKWTGHYKSDGAKQRAEFLDKKVRYLRKITLLYNNTFVFRREQTVKVPLEKPIFYGLRYRCVLKDNYADRFPGMKEAVDASGMWILFSGNEPRVCNLKSKNFTYDAPTSTINGHKCWENSWFFYPNKWYRKGNLRLIPICESELCLAVSLMTCVDIPLSAIIALFLSGILKTSARKCTQSIKSSMTVTDALLMIGSAIIQTTVLIFIGIGDRTIRALVGTERGTDNAAGKKDIALKKYLSKE